MFTVYLYRIKQFNYTEIVLTVLFFFVVVEVSLTGIQFSLY